MSNKTAFNTPFTLDANISNPIPLRRISYPETYARLRTENTKDGKVNTVWVHEAWFCPLALMGSLSFEAFIYGGQRTPGSDSSVRFSIPDDQIDALDNPSHVASYDDTPAELFTITDIKQAANYTKFAFLELDHRNHEQRAVASPVFDTPEDAQEWINAYFKQPLDRGYRSFAANDGDNSVHLSYHADINDNKSDSARTFVLVGVVPVTNFDKY